MKKILVSIIGIFLLFGLTSINGFAQSSNNEQRIVGRWTSDDDSWVFNSNGTLIVEGETYKWFVNSAKMLILDNDDDIALFCEFFLSSDGRTLLLVDEDKEVYLLKKR
jgi:hypothetical protein